MRVKFPIWSRWVALFVFVVATLTFASAEEPSVFLLGFVFPGLLSIVFSYLFALAFHEAGHLIAGWAVGFEFRRVSVSLLTIVRGNGRLRFQLSPWSHCLFGFASMLPKDDVDIERRYARFVWGGPIASLLLCGVALAIYGSALTAMPNQGFMQGWMVPYALDFFWVCVAIAAGSLIPHELSVGLGSDMKQIQMLREETDKTARMLCQMVLERIILGPDRPRDWPAHLLAKVQNPRDGSSNHAWAFFMTYYRHLDRNEIREATQALQEAVTVSEEFSIGDQTREAVLAERAFVAAYFENNVGEAEQRLKDAGKPSDALVSIWERAYAAIALRKGQRAACLLALDRAREVGERSHERNGGNVESYYDLVNAMRQEALRLPNLARQPVA